MSPLLVLFRAPLTLTCVLGGSRVVANLVFRALAVMEEDGTHERTLEKLTELRELVTGIIDDEADACEWLMLGRM